MNDKRMYFLVLIPISFLLTVFARSNSSFAEFYALNFYSKIAKVISSFTSKIPFSLAEVLIVLLVIILIIYLVFVVAKTIEYRTVGYLKDIFINIFAFTSIVYFLFVLLCGINYYRYEFTYYSGLKIEKYSKDDLVDLCDSLINDANSLRKNLKTNNSTVELFDDYKATAQRARKSFDGVSETYEVLKGNYPAPKLVLLSKAMSHMRITGVFFPFTFEANVNVHIPPYQVPSTMLHELVHLRGFMREDEANFISYLACVNSDYDDFKYSGTMLALSYSINALYLEDKEAYFEIYEKLSEDVKRDLKYSRDYWKQFETRIARVSNKVNDSYLKANNQADGVKSYGRMVDLLLAYNKVNS